LNPSIIAAGTVVNTVGDKRSAIWSKPLARTSWLKFDRSILSNGAEVNRTKAQARTNTTPTRRPAGQQGKFVTLDARTNGQFNATQMSTSSSASFSVFTQSELQIISIEAPSK
jgi:hypothetical protein